MGPSHWQLKKMNLTEAEEEELEWLERNARTGPELNSLDNLLARYYAQHHEQGP